MNNMFDAFVEKAKDVCDIAAKKTGEVVEISKLKLECVKINGEIKALYEKLGHAVYGMVKASYENQTVIDSLTEEIDESLAKLRELNAKISEIKNVCVCEACGVKNPVENYYCAHCGSKLKTDFDDGACGDINVDDSDETAE